MLFLLLFININLIICSIPTSHPSCSITYAFCLRNSKIGGDGGAKRKPDDALSSAGSNKKKKPLTNERREERNLREKERSLKITNQIQELRDLLSMGGVIVPKVRGLYPRCT